MNNKTFYSSSILLSVFFIASLSFTGQQWSRSPASADEKLTLEVQSLRVTPHLKIAKSDAVILNVTINRKHTFDLTPRLHLAAGEEIKLNSRVVIDPKWIVDGNLEFKLELVKHGLLKSVILRCAQVSKAVDSYNRSYQCSVPGSEDSPAIVYSLRKIPMEANTVAKQ